jgi:hypothetical protein
MSRPKKSNNFFGTRSKHSKKAKTQKSDQRPLPATLHEAQSSTSATKRQRRRGAPSRRPPPLSSAMLTRYQIDDFAPLRRDPSREA